jgi:hypothetical protein
VYWHYENQVMNALNLGTPGIAAGWVKGSKLELPSGYQSLLSHGFKGDGGPLEFEMRKASRHTTPDHYNPVTREIADSKYYDFSRMDLDEKKRAAAEISDTIMKARMYQAEMIKAEVRGDPGHVAHQLLDDDLDRYAMEEAVKRRMYIFTPEPIPRDVASFIQAHRGTGLRSLEPVLGDSDVPMMVLGESLGQIVYRTMKARPERW